MLIEGRRYRSLEELLASRGVYPHPKFGDFGDAVEAMLRRLPLARRMRSTINSPGSAHMIMGQVVSTRGWHL